MGPQGVAPAAGPGGPPAESGVKSPRLCKEKMWPGRMEREPGNVIERSRQNCHKNCHNAHRRSPTQMTQKPLKTPVY